MNQNYLLITLVKYHQNLDSNTDINLIKKQISQELKVEYETLQKIIVPYESLFTIVDHIKTLIFAISDGSLPSNVGGGYNLRVLLRRSIIIT